MKIGDKSILELFLYPLSKIRIVWDYWGGYPRQVANYEHAYGPLLVCSLLHFIPIIWVKWALYGLLFVFHVIIKEIYIDWFADKKPFNWPNIIERCYGMLLSSVVLL